MNLVQVDPAMTTPGLSHPEGLSGFTPEMQTKFPEAYALAIRIDQFGKNRVALLKVTLEPPKPRLLKEFTLFGRLLKKGTGHDLYTPGVHTEGFQPVAIKVEALAVATWDTTKGFVVENVRHPIQSQIDLSIGATKRTGHYLKEGMKFLVNTRDPNNRISTEMVETIDTVAANLDRLFTTWVQRHNPQHNPNSPSTRVGGVALDIACWETGLRLLRGGRVLNAVESIPLTSERLAIQSQRALLETFNRSAYRSGFVSDKTVARLAERNIRTITPQKYATSINSKVNLNAKMSAMEKVPNIAERIKTLPDGRIRYYKAERLSKTPGPTRGSSYVLEYNPKTGRVRGWDENYGHSGKVIRVHPKMINGQDIIGQHYPRTKSEIEMLLKLKGDQ